MLLPVFTTKVCRGLGSNTQPSTCLANALFHCATGAVVYLCILYQKLSNLFDFPVFVSFKKQNIEPKQKTLNFELLLNTFFILQYWFSCWQINISNKWIPLKKRCNQLSFLQKVSRGKISLIDFCKLFNCSPSGPRFSSISFLSFLCKMFKFISHF